jgi:hypothetical protein
MVETLTLRPRRTLRATTINAWTADKTKRDKLRDRACKALRTGLSRISQRPIVTAPVPAIVAAKTAN